MPYAAVYTRSANGASLASQQKKFIFIFFQIKLFISGLHQQTSRYNANNCHARDLTILENNNYFYSAACLEQATSNANRALGAYVPKTAQCIKYIIKAHEGQAKAGQEAAWALFKRERPTAAAQRRERAAIAALHHEWREQRAHTCEERAPEPS
jgi:hypothetical protein